MLAADLWQHWGAIVTACGRVLDSRDDAEECAAGVIAELVAAPPSDVRNVEAFVVTVARRRAIDRYRSERSTRLRALRYGQGELAEPDVADLVAERDEAAWVDAQARALLSPRHYQLLRQVADGVPLEQAAAALGVSRRAAEGQLYRARVLMRTALARALGILGVLLASLRRTLGSATPSTAVVAAAVILALHFAAVPYQQPELRPPRGSQSALLDQVRHVPGRDVPVSASSSGMVASRPRPSRSPAPSPSPSPQIQTAVGGVGTYTRDDGYEDQGLVDQLMHCLDTLRIEPDYKGCGDPSSSPNLH